MEQKSRGVTATGFVPGCGVDLIANERTRQVASERWLPEHDDTHAAHELAYAAACYVVPEEVRVGTLSGGDQIHLRDPWPWEGTPKFDPDLRALYAGPMAIWLTNGGKRASMLRQARIRELVKAGALIAAEIDRLQRQEARGHV